MEERQTSLPVDTEQREEKYLAMKGMTFLFPLQLSVYLALPASACGQEIAFLDPLLYPGLNNKHSASSYIYHQNLWGQHC